MAFRMMDALKRRLSKKTAEKTADMIRTTFRITESCIACGDCEGLCPVGAIYEEDKYVIETDCCLNCGACADACPVGAIVEEKL